MKLRIYQIILGLGIPLASLHASEINCRKQLEAIGKPEVRKTLNEVSSLYAKSRVDNDTEFNFNNPEVIDHLANFFVENGIETKVISDFFDLIIDTEKHPDSGGVIPRVDQDTVGNINALTRRLNENRQALPLSPRAIATLYFLYADVIHPKNPEVIRENPEILKLVEPYALNEYRKRYGYPFILRNMTRLTAPEMARELSKQFKREITETQVRKVIFAYGLSRLENWREPLRDHPGDPMLTEIRDLAKKEGYELTEHANNRLTIALQLYDQGAKLPEIVKIINREGTEHETELISLSALTDIFHYRGPEKKGQRWTEEEEFILISHYGDVQANLLAELLEKTEPSLYAKAQREGVTNPSAPSNVTDFINPYISDKKDPNYYIKQGGYLREEALLHFLRAELNRNPKALAEDIDQTASQLGISPSYLKLWAARLGIFAHESAIPVLIKTKARTTTQREAKGDEETDTKDVQGKLDKKTKEIVQNHFRKITELESKNLFTADELNQEENEGLKKFILNSSITKLREYFKEHEIGGDQQQKILALREQIQKEEKEKTNEYTKTWASLFKKPEAKEGKKYSPPSPIQFYFENVLEVEWPSKNSQLFVDNLIKKLEKLHPNKNLFHSEVEKEEFLKKWKEKIKDQFLHMLSRPKAENPSEPENPGNLKTFQAFLQEVAKLNGHLQPKPFTSIEELKTALGVEPNPMGLQYQSLFKRPEAEEGKRESPPSPIQVYFENVLEVGWPSKNSELFVDNLIKKLEELHPNKKLFQRDVEKEEFLKKWKEKIKSTFLSDLSKPKAENPLEPHSPGNLKTFQAFLQEVSKLNGHPQTKPFTSVEELKKALGINPYPIGLQYQSLFKRPEAKEGKRVSPPSPIQDYFEKGLEIEWTSTNPELFVDNLIKKLEELQPNKKLFQSEVEKKEFLKKWKEEMKSTFF